MNMQHYTFNQLLYDIEKYKLNERCDRFASVFESVLSPAFEESWGEFKSNVSGKKWYQKIIEFIKFIGRKIKEWFKGIRRKLQGTERLHKSIADSIKNMQNANSERAEKMREAMNDHVENVRKGYAENITRMREDIAEKMKRANETYEVKIEEEKVFQKKKIEWYSSSELKRDKFRITTKAPANMMRDSVSVKDLMEWADKKMQEDIGKFEKQLQHLINLYTTTVKNDDNEVLKECSKYYEEFISELNKSDMELIGRINTLLFTFNMIEKDE